MAIRFSQAHLLAVEMEDIIKNSAWVCIAAKNKLRIYTLLARPPMHLINTQESRAEDKMERPCVLI